MLTIRCHARIELKEWIVQDFENEFFKRYYEVEEFPWKLERLYKHYKHNVFAPKIYEKKSMRPVRRYYYYQEKMLRM